VERAGGGAESGGAGLVPAVAVEPPAPVAPPPPPPEPAPPAPPPPPPPPPAAPQRRALIFTMDSITDYVTRAKSGGPAGEIIVRESLEWGLRQLNIEPVAATSDAEFARLSAQPEQFDFFFLDPWTFVDPGGCRGVW
jgi:hypothetical protein